MPVEIEPIDSPLRRTAKRIREKEAEPVAKSASPLPSPTPQAVASPAEASSGDLLAQALLAFAPIAIGAAFGGAQGGSIGAQASGQGLKMLSDAEEKAEKQKKESEERSAALGLKKEELAEKTEKRKQEDRQFAVTTGLKREEIGIHRAAEGSKRAEKTEAIATDLRKERNMLPVTKQTQDVSIAYQKILGAAEKVSAAGDMSLIFNYMKMLDPGSTVREGEQAQASQATNVPGQILNLYNKAVKGERLNEAQRADFVSQSGNLHEAQLGVQNRVDEQYRSLAMQAGLDPNKVILGFTPQKTKERGDSLSRAQSKGAPVNDQLAQAMQAVMSRSENPAFAAPLGPKTKEDLQKMTTEELRAYTSGR